MNKNFWLLGLAVAALTSCTQSEVVNVPEGRAIDFDAFTNNSTRALEELSNSTLKRIHIFGYDTKTNTSDFNENPVFDNVTAIGTVNSTTAWTYTETKYWELNTTYRFAAYANGLDNDATANVDESKLDNTQVNYNPEDDTTTPVTGQMGDGDQITFTNYVNNGLKDLIASISGDRKVGDDYPTNKVSFTFDHMLSKLEFMFNLNAEHPDYDIFLSNFSINGIHKRGTGKCKFKLNATTSVYEPDIWWAPSDEKTQSLTSEGEIKLEQTSFSGVFYMIPQEFTDAYIEFTMTKKYKSDGSEIESKVYMADLNFPDLTSGKWMPGYHYRYVKMFALSEVQLHPIEFAVVDVDDWEPASTAAYVLNVVERTNSADSN